MKYSADPITMQVSRYAMEQVADEMGYTLVRIGKAEDETQRVKVTDRQA